MPRALHRRGALERLITDAWVAPGNPLGTIRRGLQGRFHSDLTDAKVYAANFDNVAFELAARARGLQGWPLMTARNEWFQSKAVSWLSRNASATRKEPPVIFAYSYAARDIFRWARQRGWRTVLGQIDPGPVEERIVAKLWAEQPDQQGQWQPTPAGYWDDWLEECALADCILVNSEWSRQALMAEGVPAERLRLIPLAYEPPVETVGFRREYPDAFTPQRPLRVLFLGQVNLRKGVGPLLEAIELLRERPIEFQFVGPIQMKVPPALRQDSRVTWIGSVPRNQTFSFYQQADVFIFPTYSDGFGLTQLEAQAWRLPVIVSSFCGDVIEDGVNGIRLRDIEGEEIANVLLELVENPDRLRAMSERSLVSEWFSLNSLALSLLGFQSPAPSNIQIT